LANDQETILGSKASLDGRLEGVNITLQGRFRGELKASGLVRILEGSDVDAKVEAVEVQIGGKFHGEINTQTLHLLRPARASGKFRAKKLSVEEGGQIDGDFEIGESSVVSKQAAAR
jgi:cytoskeletal protein CcmA (bactofilin family)